MAYEEIVYAEDGPVGTITLNRPDDGNMFTPRMCHEIRDCINEIRRETRTRVIVLTGAGARFFCIGGRKEGMEHTTLYAGTLPTLEMYESIDRLQKPVIASVNGYAVGGGHELHLFCDLTIAADTAKFGQVGPKVGSIPIWGATQMLPRLVGEKKAREILFLCRQYTAQEALEMGLVNKVVPAAALMAEVGAWCQEILDKSPHSLRIAKLALNMESDVTFHASFHAGAEMLSMFTGTEENMEGVTAFLEKRKPNYRKFRKSSS